jgi:hypothetical protein
VSLRRETFDIVCVVLEDDEGQEVEQVADDLLRTLGLQGDELLEHLDPPTGLRTWLRSHGLSLVATAEVTPPRIWDALEAEEVNQGTDTDDLEEEEIPVLQVGDYVEYQTVPHGPRQVSTMGAGYVEVVETDKPDGVWVRRDEGHAVFLNPAEDIIRLVRPRSAAPPQTVEAPQL